MRRTRHEHANKDEQTDGTKQRYERSSSWLKKNRKINEDAEAERKEEGGRRKEEGKDGAKARAPFPEAVFRGEGEGGESDAVFRAGRICVLKFRLS